MKFTKITSSKINWLFASDEFRKNPIKVIFRIIMWEFIRKFDKRTKCLFDDDLTIYLYPNDGVSRLTYYLGYNEPSIFRFLNSFLKEGMTYFDIGANIGLYSIFAAKRLGPNGKVFSFEPQKETYNRMIENIELNKLKNITSVNLAVGETNGIIAIVENEDSAKSYVSNNYIEDDKLRKTEVISFDKFVVDQTIDFIDYLKIDVEGFEFNVLKGMVNFLQKSPPKIIQMELYNSLLNRSSSSTNQVITFLTQFGYSFWKLNSKVKKLYKMETDKVIEGDVFIIKDENISNLSEYIK